MTDLAQTHALLAQLQREKAFLEGWLTDLLDTMQSELDEPIRVRLMAGCGRGCFLRHSFKQELATRGKSSLECLLAALRSHFEAWQAKDGVHIRYGETSAQCYCPVLPGQLTFRKGWLLSNPNHKSNPKSSLL